MYSAECIALTNSTLGLQYELLLICLKKYTFVLDLINKMSKLRLLLFMCKDDKWIENNSLKTKDELIK
jgi:hypothetical protein